MQGPAQDGPGPALTSDPAVLVPAIWPSLRSSPPGTGQPCGPAERPAGPGRRAEDAGHSAGRAAGCFPDRARCPGGAGVRSVHPENPALADSSAERAPERIPGRLRLPSVLDPYRRSAPPRNSPPPPNPRPRSTPPRNPPLRLNPRPEFIGGIDVPTVAPTPSPTPPSLAKDFPRGPNSPPAYHSCLGRSRRCPDRNHRCSGYCGPARGPTCGEPRSPPRGSTRCVLRAHHGTR